jgi:hypothetical protein
LDGFVATPSFSDGLHIQQLNPLTALTVETRNSVYRVLVVNPSDAKVLVHGGRFFPLLTDATLNGSSLGGGCLKLHWLGEGFCMELGAGHLTVVTSPVRAIAIEGARERPLA